MQKPEKICGSKIQTEKSKKFWKPYPKEKKIPEKKAIIRFTTLFRKKTVYWNAQTSFLGHVFSKIQEKYFWIFTKCKILHGGNFFNAQARKKLGFQNSTRKTRENLLQKSKVIFSKKTL